MSYKILIVDDEAANLRLLERLFRNQFTVFLASSGAEALEILKLHDVALIISDQRMSEMTGVEFLQLAAEMRPQTVRIILTGYTDINSLIEAINSGVVYKYVTKPWVNEDLQLTVVKALQHYETIKRNNLLDRLNDRDRSWFKHWPSRLRIFPIIVSELVIMR
jgi:DNA-binding NtrC family response regulator